MLGLFSKHLVALYESCTYDTSSANISAALLMTYYRDTTTHVQGNKLLQDIYIGWQPSYCQS